MARGFECVLVANRGEIAARVARSVRGRGARAVGLFSDVDEGALHLEYMDASVRLPGASPAETYLNIAAVLAAAKRCGADALHPGYGFLSENAELARECAVAGLVFVGPSPDAIRAMGDKAHAKRLMAQSGIPLVPGYSGAAQDDSTFRAEAERVGTPLLLKAAAGGGGRGMRRVDDLTRLDEALASARREAKSAFGDDTLILERLIERPRHIEVQVLGDTQGEIRHLFERECSVQRRHQKIIEEAPSPAVDAALRARLGEAAINAAKAVSYVGAGTVEFLLDDRGEFYFIEMNTRLQVEHPVTECVTGVDLVDLQLAIAEGEPLPVLPDAPIGHAIEARVYAEDPYDGYTPQTGTLEALLWPEAPGVRVDAGVWEAQRIGADYDPMLAKVIAFGEDREHARRRLSRALEDTALFGVGTNIEQLCQILESPVFVDARARTDWLDAVELGRRDRTLAIALGALRFLGDDHDLLGGLGRSARLRIEGAVVEVRVFESSAGRALAVGEREWRLGELSEAWAELDGIQYRFHSLRDGETVWICHRGVTLELTRAVSEAVAKRAAGDGRLRAPMAGKVVSVQVAEGDMVEAGETLIVLEAMKMEHELRAATAGRVSLLAVQTGNQVEARQVLAELAGEPDE